MIEIILLVFGVAAAAAIAEILIFTFRMRRAARSQNNHFSEEFLEEFSYLESPDGMEQDLQDLLTEEMAKERIRAMDQHPSTFEEINKLQYDVEMNQVIGYIVDETRKKKKKKNPAAGATPPTEIIKYWPFDK